MKIIVIRKWAILFLPLMIIGISVYLLYMGRTVPTFYLPITDKVIVLDAGHGGVDPGAIGKTGKNEDDINLEIALKLRKFIEQSGGVVILTREKDEGLYTEKSETYRAKKNEDLRNRRILVNESEGDVFISIHLNSFPQSQYYGAQTFYKRDCEESKRLAFLIQNEFRNTLDKNNKRVPQPRDSVYLIKNSQIPAVLIECGFLSNPMEEKLLNDSKYQEKVAWAIYIGLVRYFNNEEI